MIDTELIKKETNFSQLEFENLFNEIILSEVIKYYDNSGFDNNTFKGISFYGRKISIDNFFEFNKTLSEKKLRLLMSYETRTKRWNDFKFPNFSNIDKLYDIDNQCYHLIEKVDNFRLFNSVYSYDSDRMKFNSITSKWINKFGLELIWNDYFDIVLLFTDNEENKIEIFHDIKTLLDYKITNEISDEDRFNSIFEQWPIVRLYLK